MQKFVEDVCKLWDFLTKKERIEGINEEKSDFFHKPKIICIFCKKKKSYTFTYYINVIVKYSFIYVSHAIVHTKCFLFCL